MNAPLRADLLPQDIQDTGPVLLGMPHLALNGLSETWLLKELGHRHWLMLARMAGRAVPDFKDERGNPVYAAFRSVEIVEAAFERACENDVLSIHTSLARISRTQVRSTHRLAIDHVPIGTVVLTSVFVHRRSGSSNHSVARIEIGGLPPFDAAGTRAPPARVGQPSAFDVTAAHHRLDCTPCPAQDFNGAGFLYFTSFLAFADRAEWAFRPALARTMTTSRREVTYHANLDPGEAISLQLTEVARNALSWEISCRVDRLSDGAVLADIRTMKRRHHAG